MKNALRSPILLVAGLLVVMLGLGAARATTLSGNQVISVLTQRGQSHSPASAERSTPIQASPQATSQTFRLTGGIVTVTCAGGIIRVDDATPNTGFTVEQELKDGGAEAEIRFESATHKSRLEVECIGNEIRVEELREEAEVQPVPPAQQSSAPSMTRTFNLVGGTVTVTCTANLLTVNSAIPNAGFNVEQERKDGNQVVEFRFEGATHESRIELQCAVGQLIVEELREESR
ncbi:MAG TPA: hypothetical protein VJQ08_00830 [Candidatus Dormibacteraeota bacterium]|nr:hypothetical protein [Candidatus Dormibacteraeota bacterium]